MMPGDKNFSYWEKESFLQPFDLIVIGAGIVGLSSALFFKKKEPAARVLVLEKGMVPQGASTRNAGFACVGSIGEHIADMEKESVTGIKERMVRRFKGLKLLRNILGEAAIGYEACGGFELFTSEETFEEAAGHISRFNRWMKELLNEDQVYKTGALNGYRIIHNRLEGALHPGKMMQQLVNKVSEAGVEVRWNSSVAGVNKVGILQLDNGTILKANQLLVAINGFTPRLLPGLDISPARGLVMVTSEWDDIPWKGTFHHDCGYIYFRNIGQRLLLGGARNITTHEEKTDEFGINPSIRNYLKTFAGQKLYLPERVKIEHVWSGIMGFTQTKTPIIERQGSCLVVAAGLSGMGIAIGAEVGREAASILGE